MPKFAFLDGKFYNLELRFCLPVLFSQISEFIYRWEIDLNSSELSSWKWSRHELPIPFATSWSVYSFSASYKLFAVVLFSKCSSNFEFTVLRIILRKQLPSLLSIIIHWDRPWELLLMLAFYWTQCNLKSLKLGNGSMWWDMYSHNPCRNTPMIQLPKFRLSSYGRLALSIFKTTNGVWIQIMRKEVPAERET